MAHLSVTSATAPGTTLVRVKCACKRSKRHGVTHVAKVTPESPGASSGSRSSSEGDEGEDTLLSCSFLRFRALYFVPVLVAVGAVWFLLARAGFDEQQLSMRLNVEFRNAKVDVASRVAISWSRRIAALEGLAIQSAALPSKDYFSAAMVPALDSMLFEGDRSVYQTCLVDYVAAEDVPAFEEAGTRTLGRPVSIWGFNSEAELQYARTSSLDVFLPVGLARPPGKNLEGFDIFSMQWVMTPQEHRSPLSVAERMLSDGKTYASGVMVLDGRSAIYMASPVYRLTDEERGIALDPAEWHPELYRRSLQDGGIIDQNIVAIYDITIALEAAILGTRDPTLVDAARASVLDDGLTIIVEDVSDNSNPPVSAELAAWLAEVHAAPSVAVVERFEYVPEIEYDAGGMLECGHGRPLYVLMDDSRLTAAARDDVESRVLEAVRNHASAQLSGLFGDDNPELVARVREQLLGCWLQERDRAAGRPVYTTVLHVAGRVWSLRIVAGESYVDARTPIAWSADWYMWPHNFAILTVCLLAVAVAAGLRALEVVARQHDEKTRRREAEAAHRAQESVMSFACHELRNPLHAISACCEALKETIPGNTEERADVEAIALAAASCRTVVDDILDLTALRGGRLRVTPGPVDVRGLLRQLALQHRSFAAVPIRVEVSASLPAIVEADELRLRQLLTNGITNSCKHTTSGSIVLRAWLSQTSASKVPTGGAGTMGGVSDALRRLGARASADALPPVTASSDGVERGGSAKSTDLDARESVAHSTTGGAPAILCCEVVDTGVGLRGTKASTLFQPFRQVAPSAAVPEQHASRGENSHVRSSGLGLPICRLLARVLDGEVGLYDRATGPEYRKKGRLAEVLLPPPGDMVPMQLDVTPHSRAHSRSASDRRYHNTPSFNDEFPSESIGISDTDDAHHTGDKVAGDVDVHGAVFWVNLPVNAHAAGGKLSGGPRWTSAADLLDDVDDSSVVRPATPVGVKRSPSGSLEESKRAPTDAVTASGSSSSCGRGDAFTTRAAGTAMRDGSGDIAASREAVRMSSFDTNSSFVVPSSADDLVDGGDHSHDYFSDAGTRCASLQGGATLSLVGRHYIAVDDDRLNRRVVSRMLQALGATVVTLEDGDQLLPHLRDRHPYLFDDDAESFGEERVDGILLDIVMARMGGIEACRQIRSACSQQVAILAATGNAHSSFDLAKYRDAGFDGVMAKPFDKAQLARALLRMQRRA